jgi:hypothetical protein
MKTNRRVTEELLSDAFFPKMIAVEQVFPRPKVESISSALRQKILQKNVRSLIHPGMKVAITCGSRGIANLPEIMRTTAEILLSLGAEPFIIPAMGSHGGATAEGQESILKAYGVTEENCGVPIKSSMDVVSIGQTDDGQSVYIDKYAAESDGIVVVGRIKPHTDFRGPYESGLMKMLTVGLGKKKGAELFHLQGPERMAINLQIIGNIILRQAKILFGIGLIENAYDETARIEVLTATEIPEKEPELLLEAWRLMAKSYISDVDLLIVDQIGKDISGDGMDPNITGRFCFPGVTGGMKSQKLAILDITDESEGQMPGLGYGDVTTRRAFNKCDFEASYPNAFISTTFTPFRIPIVLESDREAIAACLKFCGNNDKTNPRVIRIRDTMHMDQIWVSEALIPEVLANPNMRIIGQPEELFFNDFGNLF